VVKVWPFPLDCVVAVNTDGRPSTCDELAPYLKKKKKKKKKNKKSL